MRALSLWQPWAELIIAGRKTWETRRWRYLPTHLVGERLAIHAAKRRDRSVRELTLHFGLDPDRLDYGAILGSVLVTEVRWLTAADEPGALCPCDGLVGIRCTEPIRLPHPLPFRGQQGFFPVDLPPNHSP